MVLKGDDNSSGPTQADVQLQGEIKSISLQSKMLVRHLRWINTRSTRGLQVDVVAEGADVFQLLACRRRWASLLLVRGMPSLSWILALTLLMVF